jgi:type IV pilus assembly protein PilB
LDALLLDAIRGGASDIHVERYEQRVRVRFRVDGHLRDITHYELSPDDANAMVNVVKVESNLDIAERRLPQGGRFRRRAGDRTCALRVQTQPVLHGENLVIRLLQQRTAPPLLEELGFPDEAARVYRRLLHSPQGLVIVCGPTGSGKSTTLYAGLRVLSEDSTRKVLSVEDPVEYTIGNVQQSQVHPEVGFTFATALRAFLREDPNVILLGEIRDGETAIGAIQASQTGHLVLSTLSCSDSVDAIQRLYDLGVQPGSIGSVLAAVVAQRLARRVCPGCAREVSPDPEIASEVFPEGLPDDLTVRRERGCDACAGTGARGRTAVVELLLVTPELRGAIARRAPADELLTLAHASGLVTMRDHAVQLVREGVISFEEIPRILTPEQLARHRPTAR